jgi:HEAT repeat protein
MPKRFLLPLLAGLVALAWAAAALWPREPVYKDKTLTEWLDQLTPASSAGRFSWLVGDALRTARMRQAQAAIHAMGSKVVPFLLRKVAREHRLTERIYAALWPKLPVALRKRVAAPTPNQTNGSPPARILSAFEALDSDAVPELIIGLKSSNREVRITALAALGVFGAKAAPALPTITELASNPDAFVRRWALVSLSRLGPTRTNAMPIVVAALTDSETSPQPGASAHVRATAARVLGDIGPPAQAAIPQLKKLLTDSDSDLRQESALALWRISRSLDALPVLVSELKRKDDPQPIVTVLNNMGPEAKTAVPTVKAALASFWHPGAPKTGVQTIDLLGYREESFEHVINEALQKIDPPTVEDTFNRALPKLSSLELNERRSWMFASAAGVSPADSVAAMRRNPSAAATFLLQVLDDPNPDMRLQAMLTLSQINWKPGPDLDPRFIEMLRDRSAFKYRNREDKELGPELVCIGDLAAEFLGIAGPEARPAIAPLRALLTDSSWSQRPYAALALWRISHDTNVLEYIIPNLRSPGTAGSYRRFLAVAAEMGPAAQPAIPALLRGMTNLNDDVSGPVEEALKKITSKAAAAFNPKNGN